MTHETVNIGLPDTNDVRRDHARLIAGTLPREGSPPCLPSLRKWTQQNVGILSTSKPIRLVDLEHTSNRPIVTSRALNIILPQVTTCRGMHAVSSSTMDEDALLQLVVGNYEPPAQLSRMWLDGQVRPQTLIDRLWLHQWLVRAASLTGEVRPLLGEQLRSDAVQYVRSRFVARTTSHSIEREGREETRSGRRERRLEQRETRSERSDMQAERRETRREQGETREKRASTSEESPSRTPSKIGKSWRKEDAALQAHTKSADITRSRHFIDSV